MIDKLIRQVRHGFSKITDIRRSNQRYSLTDILSAAYAIFALKDPSVLAFREEYPNRSTNLKQIYGIENIPADTAMRQSLDGVDPKELQELFRIPLEELRHSQVLSSRQLLEGYLVVAADGTQHYCSCKTSCEHCLTKKHRNGKVSYYHQLLGAVLVHPDESTVFPVMAEPIVRQDGATKNDCERNAAKRLIPLVRDMLREDKILMTFDALYANGPVIRLLIEHNMSFITGIKEGYVLVQVERLKATHLIEKHVWSKGGKGNIQCKTYFKNGLVLNGQHQDLLINYFEYEEVDTSTGEQVFYSSWITDQNISEQNIELLVKIARARWKIENETFNTLKNQGYHLEHNYGHGKKYLASNFALLTFLAFLVDQIAQTLDNAFQKAMKVYKTKKAFWRKVQQVFDVLPAMSMNAIYRFISGDIQINLPKLE